MMAKIAEEPFDSPDWIFEVKLDGYRGIAVFDTAGKPHLWSRNGLPLEQKFPAVAKALSRLKLRSTILDGEVVAVDENGIPRFQLLQRFQKQPTAPTLYYVFDMLWSDRIVAVMTAKTETAAELRQASPFAGALTQKEIARTIHREKERARTRY